MKRALRGALLHGISSAGIALLDGADCDSTPACHRCVQRRHLTFAIPEEAKMRHASSRIQRTLGLGAATAWLVLLSTPTAMAQEAMDPDAASVLASMQTYLSGLQTFTAQYEVEIDTVTFQGEKLKFLSAGELVVERPGKLYASRKGSIADAEIFVDGTNVTIFGSKLKGYVQFAATTIDEAIDAIRDNTEFDAPGADLLSAKPLDSTITDMLSGTHIGMAYVGGVEVHHLAFRGKTVDWQLWVQSGDQPLPLKYVITSKWVFGAPQYSLRISNWNVAPQIEAARFTFTPPAEAMLLSEAKANEIGELGGGEE
jgi:hypothetical protein